MLKQTHLNLLKSNSFKGLLYRKTLIGKELAFMSGFTIVLSMMVCAVLSFFIDFEIISILSIQALITIILFFGFIRVNNLFYSLDEAVVNQSSTRLKFNSAQALFKFDQLVNEKDLNADDLEQFFNRLFPQGGGPLLEMYIKYSKDTLAFYKQINEEERSQIERYFLIDEINLKH